jgi:uncharacterized phage protein gp47/JayE
MYEAVTYEEIMTRMLDRVRSEYPNIDTREGSLVYTAIAPCALELAIMYTELDRVLEEVFADTASLEYLEKRTIERGITQRLASPAVMKVKYTPNQIVRVGTQFSLGDFNYTVIDQVNNYVQCDTAGSEPNTIFGALTPHVEINGLESAEIIECVVPGEDDEDVEDLRTRYFDSIGVQSYGFNVKQYREVVNDIDGVGATKVIPAYPNPGNVTLVIVDSNYSKPSDELVATVKQAIDPNDGDGLGLAPIGHTVIVNGASEASININCNFTYTDTYTWDIVKEDVYKAIDNYFVELSKEWESGIITVRVSHIIKTLLDIVGVEDVTDVTINGTDDNCELGENDIPVRGTVNGNS